MIEGSKKAILIIGEGSPKSSDFKDVKDFYSKVFNGRYLRQERNKIEKLYFEKVSLKNFSTERSNAYKKAEFDGEMANHIALENLRNDIEQEVKVPVYKAFTIEEKSIENSLTEAYAKGAESLLVIPLFPFYTVFDYDQALLDTFKIAGDKHPDLNLMVIPPFFQHRGFNKRMADLIDAQNSMFGLKHLHILYKGIPENTEIEYINEDKGITYKEQIEKSVEDIKNEIKEHSPKLEIEFSHSFLPMKLGDKKYQQPETFSELKKLFAQGVKNITFIYPSTVIDNVDSLYDVEVELIDYAKKLGFEKVDFIPSLNNHPAWKTELTRWIDEWLFS
jgi:protoporphyrin/coproporphyrin ferrochelatase